MKRERLDQNPNLWESLYEQAITEADPDLRRRRLLEAQAAIVQRALALDREPGDHESEARALEEASDYIREKKAETLTDGVGKEVEVEDQESLRGQARDPATDIGEHCEKPTPQKPHATPDLVISVGALPELLWLREAVLKNAGFQVLTFSDEEKALAEIQNVDCGVLLLCYSVQDSIRQQLTTKYREACPGARIVAITNEPVQEPLVNIDAWVYGVEGPEALIDAVQRKL